MLLSAHEVLPNLGMHFGSSRVGCRRHPVTKVPTVHELEFDCVDGWHSFAIFERFANRFIVAVDGLVLVLVLVLKFDVFCKTFVKFLGNFRESLFVVFEEKGATHVGEFALCP